MKQGQHVKETNEDKLKNQGNELHVFLLVVLL